MTRATTFCPRCGADTTETAMALGERGLCRSCYLEEHDLVTMARSVTITRCGSCGSVERDGDWADVDDDRIDLAVDAVADTVEVHRAVDDLHWEVVPEVVDGTTVSVDASFDLVVAGDVERRERTAEVTVQGTTCPRCGRIAGEDYGSVVQLRATDRTPAAEELEAAREIAADVLEDRVDVGDRGSYLTDVIEREEGLDLRLSTPRLGEQVATAIRTALGGTLDRSRTLVTTDGDGREVYRVTQTLRLPAYRPGDVLALDDTAALVEGGNQQVDLRDLRSGEVSTVAGDDLTADRVGRRSDATPVTIVAIEDDHAVQILHPRTQAAVTVARYDDLDLGGATVPALEVGTDVYLLPADDE